MPRYADVVLSALALVVLAPLLACIAGLVLLAMGRPVFFVQARVGYRGRSFDMVKFRSLTSEGQPTALGKVLRRFSLDELPSFWNVLRGDMALVGPRPLLAEHQPPFAGQRAERQSMKPGLTGWAQVNGRNALSFEESFVHDGWYRRNRCPRLDLHILLLTLPVVAAGRGACGLVDAARRGRLPEGSSAPGKAGRDSLAA